MDKLEISINKNNIFTLDKIDIKTIKYGEKIPEENWLICVKDWATMIFEHRLKRSKKMLIDEWTKSIDGQKNLLEQRGYTHLPCSQKELIKIIIETIEKKNDSTGI